MKSRKVQSMYITEVRNGAADYLYVIRMVCGVSAKLTLEPNLHFS